MEKKEVYAFIEKFVENERIKTTKQEYILFIMILLWSIFVGLTVGNQKWYCTVISIIFLLGIVLWTMNIYKNYKILDKKELYNKFTIEIEKKLNLPEANVIKTLEYVLWDLKYEINTKFSIWSVIGVSITMSGRIGGTDIILIVSIFFVLIFLSVIVLELNRQFKLKKLRTLSFLENYLWNVNNNGSSRD